MTLLLGIPIGILAFIAVRIALHRLLLVKLRHDVAALNAGDHRARDVRPDLAVGDVLGATSGV